MAHSGIFLFAKKSNSMDFLVSSRDLFWLSILQACLFVNPNHNPGAAVLIGMILWLIDTIFYKKLSMTDRELTWLSICTMQVNNSHHITFVRDFNREVINLTRLDFTMGNISEGVHTYDICYWNSKLKKYLEYLWSLVCNRYYGFDI